MQMGSTKKEELSFESMLRDIEKQTNNLPERTGHCKIGWKRKSWIQNQRKRRKQSPNRKSRILCEIMGEETQNLPGQIKFDLEKEEQNSHSEQQNKKLDSKQKLQEFLEKTTDIYSGKHRTIVTSHTATIHKITPEEVNRFRKFDLAESQCAADVKNLKSCAKQKPPNLYWIPNRNKNGIQKISQTRRFNFPELDLYEDEPKEEAELEYNQPSDAAEVENRLKRMKKHSLLRLLGTGSVGAAKPLSTSSHAV